MNFKPFYTFTLISAAIANFTPINPPPLSVCPLASDRCTNGGISVLASNPGIFKCWIKVNNSWKCAPYQNGSCNPSINYVDISKCQYTPPLPSKYCPTTSDRCTNNGINYRPTDLNAPPCWIKLDNGWGCAPYQSNGKCNPSIFYIDVTKCNLTPINPPPLSVCPLASDRCTNGGISVLASNPGIFKCWIKVNNSWKCAPYQNGSCNPSINYVDISRCQYYSSPPNIKCPNVTSTCTDCYGNVYDFYNSNAPKCWSFNKNSWKCRNPVYGSCSNSEINISNCKTILY